MTQKSNEEQFFEAISGVYMFDSVKEFELFVEKMRIDVTSTPSLMSRNSVIDLENMNFIIKDIIDTREYNVEKWTVSGTALIGFAVHNGEEIQKLHFTFKSDCTLKIIQEANFPYFKTKWTFTHGL